MENCIDEYPFLYRGAMTDLELLGILWRDSLLGDHFLRLDYRMMDGMPHNRCAVIGRHPQIGPTLLQAL